MQDQALAKRYGEAYLAVLDGQGAMAAGAEDLRLLLAVMQGSSLEKLLANPKVEAAEKKALLKGTFEGKIHPATLRLLDLLIDKRRGGSVHGIVEGTLALIDKRSGILDAEAIVPLELSPALTEKLLNNLEKSTGKRIRLTVKVDPELVGGITIRVGDRLLDGSFKTFLANLKKSLKEAKVA